jgi:EmrB/QacA subfamily drug resistance transporter
MVFLDGSALNVALPALQHDLDASAVGLLWVLNGYLLVLAALVLEGGALGDQLGRKRVCLAGVALFALASLACVLAPTTGWLIAARFVQGMGGALLVPGSLALISAAFPAKKRGQAIGTWSASTTLVLLGGPALGGWLADAGWWRAIFLLNLPLGAVAFGVLWFKVPETRDEQAGGDWLGAVLAVLGLAALSLGLLMASGHGWRHPLVWGSVVGGLAALGLFVGVEKRTPHPMLPLDLFHNRTFRGTNLLTLLLYGALTAASVFLSLNLVQVQGYSQLQAGLAFIPLAGMVAAGARLAGQWADRHGPRPLLLAGPIVVGLSFAWLGQVGLTPGPAAYWSTFFPGMVLFGLGMALTVVPLTTAVMTAVPDHYAGTASGVNNAVSRTAGVLALALLGAFALTHFAGQLEQRTTSLHLPAVAQAALRTEAGKFGAAAVPTAVPAPQRPAVRQAIRESFRQTYQQVLWLCAFMALASAGFAYWLIPTKH